jgi:hypothetical protein
MTPLTVVVLAATLGAPPDGSAPPRFDGEDVIRAIWADDAGSR